MITWKRYGIRIAEVWFDEPEPVEGIDLCCFVQHPKTITGAYNNAFSTILLDLQKSENDLLGAMNAGTRYKIRKAAKEGFSCEVPVQIDSSVILTFCDFYNHFAVQKGICRLNYSDAGRYASVNMLDLSMCREESGKAVVWHSHIIAGGRARLWHSASLSPSHKDSKSRNAIGRANRYLHWHDILRFGAAGFAYYDFGGWYDGRSDLAKLGINNFKEEFGGRIVREFNCHVMHTQRGRLASWIRRLRNNGWL